MKKQFLYGLLFLAFVLSMIQQRVIWGQPLDEEDALWESIIARSLQATATRLHLHADDARLRVVAVQAVSEEDLAFTAYWVKILDSQTETLDVYWYNTAGQPTTEREAFQTRAVAYEAQYGHFSRNLSARIAKASASDLIPVAIWAEQGLGSNGPILNLPFKVYLPLVLRIEMTRCETPIECIVQFIEGRGYRIDYSSTEVPVVYATLPATVLNDLQTQNYVAAIYEQAVNQDMLYSAARTSAAPWTWARGITGSGTKVAVLEVPELCGTGGSGIATSNPYVSASAYYRAGDQVSTHATMVAGVIASTHATERGIAYGATLLSANAGKTHSIIPGFESDIIAAADWAIGAGADVINTSFGSVCGDRTITSQDKYFDWVVWEKHKTVVAAAGNLLSNPNKPPYCPWYINWDNYYCPSNRNVASPGKAYNVLTVGAKDDKNTAETEADTQDDQFSTFSLYVDPETTSSNRLKPEVIAVGQRINTTISQPPWIGEEAAGTSFSSPIVAGEAALMMQRRDWLKFSPEAVKAGIMASARWTRLKDDIDPNQWAAIDKMGVGAVDTTAADNSLLNNRVQGLYLHEQDFNNGYYDINFEVTVPERIRVIIVWSSHPSRVWITDWILHDRLESDFDLTVSTPDGQLFGSYADEANYEIVEFMAPVTGTYRARLQLSRWDKFSMEERIGFAWYSGVPLP